MLPSLLAGGERRASTAAWVWAGARWAFPGAVERWPRPELLVRREGEGLWPQHWAAAPSEPVPGSHCPSEAPDLAMVCHHVLPRTAESPALTSTCWDPFAGDTSLQTKHFCYSLTFHFQTSCKPAPRRPSLDPRDNISTPEQHFVPCVH